MTQHISINTLTPQLTTLHASWCLICSNGPACFIITFKVNFTFCHLPTHRWSSQEARTLSGSAPFRLTPPDFPDSMLRSALKCARAADRGTKPGAEFGILMADAISPLPASAALLSYSLPATAGVQAPLLVRLGAAALALRGGGVGVLLTLQCAVSAEVGRTFRGGCRCVLRLVRGRCLVSCA